MKIAIITERVDKSLGGAERSVLELASALHLLGAEVNILAAKGASETKNVYIFFPHGRTKRTNFFIFEKALKDYISANKYDIVHSVLPFEFVDIYQPRGGTYAETILRNAASQRNIIVEFYKRIFSVFNTRRTTLLRAERNISQSQSGPLIAALSQYVAEQFRQHYNTNPERIVVIPNGVKIGLKADENQTYTLRSKILAKLSLKEADNPVLFLFAANNFRLKGLSPLIKAMAIAAEKVGQRKICLIVAGSDNTKIYQRLARSAGLKNILFMGALGHIQNVLAATDVAVLPTFYDPSSRFILEALASGKPAITTKFNGAADLFVNNRHGIVIDSPLDIDGLADAIVYFADTKKIQSASQSIAQDNLKENISISRVAEQLMKVYDNIIQKKGRQ
jgi:UDP-glucose:(heptosyl)LPS alpha-1,3-glucosyltransferase